MKFIKTILLFSFLILIGGCATSRFKSAEDYLKRKEYTEAIRAYLRHLDPHVRGGKRFIYFDKDAISGIGVSYWYLGKYQTAEKIFKMVTQKAPDYGKARFYLGLTYESLGNEDEAIRTYQKYHFLDGFDPYRKIMTGRLDWLVRKKIAQEIEVVLKNESSLDFNSIPDKTVAVLYFLNLSEDPQWQPLQKGLAEMIITDLSQIDELKVVERLRINQLMDELRLGLSGLTDENNTIRIGKLVGARSFVKGSYMVTPNLNMTLDAGIYEPQTVYLPTTVNFEGSLARLFRMEKELVLKILNYYNVDLSIEEREVILKIPTEDMMAFMEYCRGLDALDQGDFKSAQKYFQKALKRDPNFKLAQDYMMSPKVWEMTHNRNLVRVNYEVAEFVRKLPKQQKDIIFKEPELVNTWNRLQVMSIQQNAGFLPGNDTREAFMEADDASLILPRVLSSPIQPPTP